METWVMSFTSAADHANNASNYAMQKGDQATFELAKAIYELSRALRSELGDLERRLKSVEIDVRAIRRS